MANISTSLDSRILTLLGAGVSPSHVAASLGCTESYISQLMSSEEFKSEVTTLRFENLQKHNERDSKYDSLEDKLLEKLEDNLPLMHRPMEILKSIQIVNAAKRRGTSTPEAILEKQAVVQLVMPSVVVQKFTTNIQNQVIQTGNQQLLTMQSGTLASKLKEVKGENDECTAPSGIHTYHGGSSTSQKEAAIAR